MRMSILKKIGESPNRIFEIEETENGFRLTEACDYHYDIELTPEELQQLVDELQAIVDGKSQPPEYERGR